ncbi:alpha/beta fold hydrolase [uncultured Amnibacterium sp.]|uniref:alpha/beta fold hydrolase n=1 Tax=uncultured Amnibacterium sp. TaxID=1631851 RepID=UPI0035CBC04E
MELTESADGTRIAFERFGDGAPVVVVGGAFSTSSSGAPLAAALAAVGFQGVAYDRRARGGSGDTGPYAPTREAEDLTAVIEAVGGSAVVLGHSSGAMLALFAAGEGAPISDLFLSEPPFHFGVEPSADDLSDRLQALVDAGEPEDAVTLFQREAVGLPEQVVAQIRASPMFAQLVPLAQSAVYDAILTAEVETPTVAMTGVGMPVTILRGEPTFPFLVGAAERLAAAIPHADLVVVPESHDHGVDPEATARLVRSRVP